MVDQSFSVNPLVDSDRPCRRLSAALWHALGNIEAFRQYLRTDAVHDVENLFEVIGNMRSSAWVQKV